MPTLCKIEEDVIELSKYPNDEIEFFDFSDKSKICDFLNLFFHQEKNFLPEKYKKMFSELSCNKPGFQYLSSASTRLILHDFVEEIDKIFYSSINREYHKIFSKINNFLNTMSQPLVNVNAINNRVSQCKFDGVVNNYKSFLPVSNGKAETIRYSQTSTLTGRLTVKSGPNILTAPSDIRNCFLPATKNGKIVQIDLISAEPKFALYATQAKVPDDVYNAMCKLIFKNKLTREQAKLVTLCVLYGQSKRNLSKKIPPTISVNNVCKQTSRYFSYDRLVKDIKEGIEDNFMKNYFGRPIKINDCSDNVLVNYFLQSSVAEASLLMFSDLCKEHKNFLTPLYVIHDALIADATESFFDLVDENDSIDLFLGEWKFKSKIKILSDNYKT